MLLQFIFCHRSTETEKIKYFRYFNTSAPKRVSSQLNPCCRIVTRSLMPPFSCADYCSSSIQFNYKNCNYPTRGDFVIVMKPKSFIAYTTLNVYVMKLKGRDTQASGVKLSRAC